MFMKTTYHNNVLIKQENINMLNTHLNYHYHHLLRIIEMSIKGVLSVLLFWIAVVLVIWISINMTKGMFAILTLVGLIFSVVFISVETYNKFK